MTRAHTRLILPVLFITNWVGGRPIDCAEPEIVTNSIGMELVKIPSGDFLMGGEEGPDDVLRHFPYCGNRNAVICESPQHRVRITHAFYMGKYEVTIQQFSVFCATTVYKPEIARDGLGATGYNERHKEFRSSDFRPWHPIAWDPKPDHPVVFVTWNDASEFCKWLSKKEGKAYRLPTEAEWEYCCRAGGDSRYCWGTDPEQSVRFANMYDEDRTKLFPGRRIGWVNDDGRLSDDTVFFPSIAKSDGFAWVSPVGQFLPNGFGLCDMHGNVSEWCSDWFDEAYYGRSRIDDPQGPTAGIYRVIRGGGYDDPPYSMRSASRFRAEPSTRSCAGGFRVVRSQ